MVKFAITAYDDDDDDVDVDDADADGHAYVVGHDAEPDDGLP